MHISSLIGSLHEHLVKHGDAAVCPKGDSLSAARSVYFENGRIIISDSYIAGLAHMFDDAGDNTNEEEEIASLEQSTSTSNLSALIGILLEFLDEVGDLVVCPNGDGNRAAEAAYVDNGQLVVTNSALAADAVTTYQRAQEGFQRAEFEVSDTSNAGQARSGQARKDGWDEAREVINSLPVAPFSEWATGEREAVEDRWNIAFSESETTTSGTEEGTASAEDGWKDS